FIVKNRRHDISCPIFNVGDGGRNILRPYMMPIYPENWHVNPIYGVSVAQAGGSPPAVSQKFANFFHTDFQI
ncbi:MAG: hypothetical protein SFZ02_00530, partial [bacterium]|nr:hypothetical protein [bacterium]